MNMDHLVSQLVKRIGWSGDGRRGTVRLEVGRGDLAGATLLVEADAGGVDVDVELPAGVSADAYGARLRQRLEARGLTVRSLNVR
jgi:hypothetical protein